MVIGYIHHLLVYIMVSLAGLLLEIVCTCVCVCVCVCVGG